MSKAKAQFNKFLDDIKPHTKEYAQFWMDMFKELGFDVSDNKNTYNILFEATYNRPDGTTGNYTVYTRPTWCQGITIYGGVRDGKHKNIKCLSETGVFRFCKDNNVGNLK